MASNLSINTERVTGYSGAEPGNGLAALLADAEACLGSLWPKRRAYPEQLRGLRERLLDRRLQIAVLGQFKRGKSTFLNALLGQAVLPTGVLPLTAVSTFIRWGSAPGLEAKYLDGRREPLPAGDVPEITRALFRLVTEEGNPNNQAEVARVDLELPAPILRGGIVLIDTPGIGSTLQHNTDAALRVLPECDAGFMVLSADPPLTAAELDYLDRMRPHVARLFFVFNKIDYLAADDRPVAIDFLRRALREHLPAGVEIPIFSMSARRALEAKRAEDAEGILASGLAQVERHLSDFLARDKDEALRRAVIGKAAAVLDAARMDIALALRAFEMPIEELETRAAQFAQALEGIERRRLVARDLLAGDRRRARESLEGRAGALRSEARSALELVLDRAFANRPGTSDLEIAVKQAIAAAIPEFFGPKLDQVSRSFADEIEAVLACHVQEADGVIASVRETAAALFEIPPIAAGRGESFIMGREPFWVTQKWDQTIGSLAGGALDRLLPAGLRVGRVRARLTAEIEELVQRNVENLRWATLQNLDAAFQRFSEWFDERLAETIDATRGAIETALDKRRERAEEAEATLREMRQAAEDVAALQRDLAAAQRCRPAEMHPERTLPADLE